LPEGGAHHCAIRQTEFAAHLHTPDISTGSLLSASGGILYLQALPRSVQDLYIERPVTFCSASLDLRDVDLSHRLHLPDDPADLFVALQRCLQDTKLHSYQLQLLRVEFLAARITQTRAAPQQQDAPHTAGSASHILAPDSQDVPIVASYKLSVSFLGDITRTWTAMSTQGYELYLASTLDVATCPRFRALGNITFAYPFRHPAMTSGRDGNALYDRDPNAQTLTISLSNSTTKDAVPACFPPMIPPPDASTVWQINLLDITNDAVALLRTGHCLPQCFNKLDTAQLMPFTEIRKDKFIYVLVLDFSSRHVPNPLPPIRFSIGTTFEGSPTFVFQTTLQATFTIGIAPLHASIRADGTPGRFLHDSRVIIGPAKFQNPPYDSAISHIFAEVLRGTAQGSSGGGKNIGDPDRTSILARGPPE
jgi:hypothetical protein